MPRPTIKDLNRLVGYWIDDVVDDLFRDAEAEAKGRYDNMHFGMACSRWYDAMSLLHEMGATDLPNLDDVRAWVKSAYAEGARSVRWGQGR
jgi:hypothetical protein